jgi:putative salt-induced outer membrane protein YdiY
MQSDHFKYRVITGGLMLLCVAALAATDEVILKNGDVIRGTLHRKTHSEVVIDHNNLGRLTISASEIEEVRTRANGEPNAPAGIIIRAQQKGWSFSFDLSLDSSTGNTDEQSLRTALALGRKRERSSFKLHSSYYYKMKKGKTSDNKYYAGYEHRLFEKDSRLYYFGAGLYDYDDFKSWQQRLSGYGGPGYSWVKTKNLTFESAAGLGARKEWGSINDNVKFEGILNLGFNWDLSQRQNIETGFYYAPVLTDVEDYRSRGFLNWRYLLSRNADIGLLIGLLHEYQSVVNPGDKKEDIRIHTGVQFRF